MNALIVFVVILAIMFVIAFITKRRFGVLALALFAGSYLAQTWTATTAPFFAPIEPSLAGVGLTAESLAQIVIALLPSFVLLLSGPTYHSKWPRIIGASGYTLLGAVLLTPLLSPLIGDADVEAATSITVLIMSNYTLLVTIGLTTAIVDLFLAHSRKSSPDKKHHKHAKH